MNPELLRALLAIYGPVLVGVIAGAWLARRWFLSGHREDDRRSYPIRSQFVAAVLALVVACVLTAALAAVPRPVPPAADFVAFHYPSTSWRGAIVQIPVLLGAWLVGFAVLQKWLVAPDSRGDPRGLATLLIRGAFCLVAGLLVHAGLGGVFTAVTEQGMVESGGFGSARTSAWHDLRGWFRAQGETRDGQFRPHPHYVVDFEPGGRWTLGLRPFFEVAGRPECEAALRARTGTEPLLVREAPPY